MPQFTYMTPVSEQVHPQSISRSDDTSESGAFAFSALFQSSSLSASAPLLQPTPLSSQKSNKSILREQTAASFIGFSWGPSVDAFKPDGTKDDQNLQPPVPQTPRLMRPPFTPLLSKVADFTATPQRHPFMTPLRPSGMTPFHTLPRGSTVRRTAQRRAVSDREAMKQLVSCVGMSARKKVLESGRKPRVLGSAPATGSRGSRASTLKELRFDRSVMVVHGDSGVSYRVDAPSTSESGLGASLGMSFGLSASASASASASLLASGVELTVPSDTDGESESDAPPSPSPSPRPGSAMSMMSRRSQTPTVTSFNLAPRNHRSMPSTESSKPLLSPLSPVEPVWSTGPAQNIATASHPGGESTSYDALDELQRRHDKLMQDIFGIAGRLDEMSFRLSRRT